MSREQIRKFRYTCDGHAEDGRECGATADFEAGDRWDADAVATEVGWVVDMGSHYCQASHTPWFQYQAARKEQA